MESRYEWEFIGRVQANGHKGVQDVVILLLRSHYSTLNVQDPEYLAVFSKVRYLPVENYGSRRITFFQHTWGRRYSFSGGIISKSGGDCVTN